MQHQEKDAENEGLIHKLKWKKKHLIRKYSKSSGKHVMFLKRQKQTEEIENRDFIPLRSKENYKMEKLTIVILLNTGQK